MKIILLISLLLGLLAKWVLVPIPPPTEGSAAPTANPTTAIQTPKPRDGRAAGSNAARATPKWFPASWRPAGGQSADGC